MSIVPFRVAWFAQTVADQPHQKALADAVPDGTGLGARVFRCRDDVETAPEYDWIANEYRILV